MNILTRIPILAITAGFLLAVFLFGVLPVHVGAQESPKFNPKVIVKKPFPAIVQPKVDSAAKAMKSLDPRELVLGVEINGISRAYPVNMLTDPRREIINDELGGESIAATW